MADFEEVKTSALYADDPLWSDVTPIYLLPDEQGAVRIAASEEFYDAFAYFRAILQSREMSERVLRLLNDCIRLNSANYSAWQYRRDLLKALNMDLRKELTYISEVISENTKNYQVWHHRRWLVEQLGSPVINEEMEFTSDTLKEEPKNYHAWQHRHWILQRFPDQINADVELAFSLRLIMEDLRNNSAWNYRYALLEHENAFTDNDKAAIEINTCFKLLERMPNNESIWNFIAGISEEVAPEKKAEIIAFVEDLYERTDAPKRSPYLVSFLGDVLLERIEKEEDVETSHKRAKDLYVELENLDPVRRNYWRHMQLRAENLFQKHLLKISEQRSQQE